MESLISFVVRKTPARSHRAAGQQLQNPFKMTACALERFASLLERFPSVERSLRVLDTGLAAMHVVEAELHHPGNGSIIHHKTCLWHQDRFLQHALVRAAEKAHFLLAAGCWGQSYYLGESKDNMAKRFWFLRLLLIFSGFFHMIQINIIIHIPGQYLVYSLAFFYLLLWLLNFEGLETKELRESWKQ